MLGGGGGGGDGKGGCQEVAKRLETIHEMCALLRFSLLGGGGGGNSDGDGDGKENVHKVTVQSPLDMMYACFGLWFFLQKQKIVTTYNRRAAPLFISLFQSSLLQTSNGGWD